MPNNKIIQVVALVILMLLSMWAISALLEVRDATRNVILGTGGFIILLSILWRTIPLDAKLLFLCVLGYALGGKGFAYLSPAKPFFIGEIAMALCGLGFLFRWRQWGLFDTGIHRWVWVYLIYAGIHLQYDYHYYRLTAVRDSAMAYYAFFFLAVFVMFRNQRLLDAFEKVVKILIVFALLGGFGALLARRGLPVNFPGFLPIADAYFPPLAGVTLLFFVRGMEEKKIRFILLGVVAAGLVVSVKTSGVIVIMAVIFAAILWGRLKNLAIPTIILAGIGIVALAIVTMVNPDYFTESIASGETAAQFGVEGGDFVGFSGTSKWRIDWWTNIWRNTMAIAPFWGQGFGADITGPFLKEWLGLQADPEGYARYPHCIMFTIIGRLGLVGLIIFGALFITIGIFSLRYSKRFFQSAERRDADLIAFGVVIGGMTNGLLQATYEIPHAAITHWVCLGYMAARYYAPRTTNVLLQEPEESLSAEKYPR